MCVLLPSLFIVAYSIVEFRSREQEMEEIRLDLPCDRIIRKCVRLCSLTVSHVVLRRDRSGNLMSVENNLQQLNPQKLASALL